MENNCNYIVLIKMLLLTTITLISGIGKAQEVINPMYTDEHIQIDGKLSERIWNETSWFNDFHSYRPDFGKELKDSTFVAIAYDNENLYVAFRCPDSDPGKIKASVAARDQIIDDDWVCINLDSRDDRLGTNSFVVNPNGIQYDSWATANSEDRSIDMVWYSAGEITSSGYSIEMKIPFKSLRFNSRDTVTMGVLFERRDARTNTHVTFPALDPARGNAYQVQLMRIKLTGIRSYNILEVLPSLTYTFHQHVENQSLLTDQNSPDPGINIKYGISTSVILDATVNPDFSQVEADAEQVDINLRTQLYYPEKRPFFMEGSDKFNIAATNSSVIDPVWQMVNTRNIVDPFSGLKLTGNINKHNSLAVLYAADRLEKTANDRQRFIHYPVIRYKYNFGTDNYFGGLYTGSRSFYATNQAYGLDGQFRINRTTMLEFNGFYSHGTDTLSAHTGTTSGVVIRHSERKLDWTITMKDVGKDFSASTAYVTRTGLSQVSALFIPKIYPDSSYIRRIDFELFGSFTYDHFYSLSETMNSAAVTFLPGKLMQIKLKASYSTEIYLGEKFNTSGVHALFSGRIGKWFSGSVLCRHVNAVYYSLSPMGGESNRLYLEMIILPSERLNLSFNYTYNDFTSEGSKIYDYQIGGARITYQMNKFLFMRYTGEYNSYRKSLLTDLLLSFTYIPGTVFHLGYGSLYQQDNPEKPFLGDIRPSLDERGIFCKVSYLFRN
jgi:hypothetical protein